MQQLAKEAWDKVQEKGIWRQTPGQRTELVVEKVADAKHLLYDEDAKLLGQEPLTIRLKAGELAGRDREDELVLIRDEREMLRFLEENLDDSPDETFLPGSPEPSTGAEEAE
jgi:hypothetical protein